MHCIHATRMRIALDFTPGQVAHLGNWVGRICRVCRGRTSGREQGDQVVLLRGVEWSGSIHGREDVEHLRVHVYEMNETKHQAHGTPSPVFIRSSALRPSAAFRCKYSCHARHHWKDTIQTVRPQNGPTTTVSCSKAAPTTGL